MKFIEDMHLKNKRVILRCDFNVPIKDGKIMDDSKIVKSLKTINYLIEKECKIIILSHLGRVKSQEDKINNTLLPVKERLEELLNQEVTFVTNFDDPSIYSENQVKLFENTRIFDFPEKLESSNSLELAKKWAELADVFVFDAFGSAHRSHSSTAGISHYLPTCIGYLVKSELENLSLVAKNPKRPFVVIMGGAKVDDKLPLIKTLLSSCDYLLIGGGIANSFLKANNINVGDSLATNEPEILEELKYLIELYNDKIILPIDFKVKNNENILYKSINSIESGDKILDISTKTVNKFEPYISNASTVFMNGTMGLCEDENFRDGTIRLFDLLTRIPTVVIGGGDTVTAVNTLGYTEDFILSSGGGASLEFIAKGYLDALEEIESNEHEKISM